ncbi:MAG: alpha-ribazole transporter [bacterium]
MSGRFQAQTRKVQVQGRDTAVLLRSLRLVCMICLSLLGSMVRLPLPTGEVALETFPGYFAALAFGWFDGALVAGISHLLVAFTGGFPLGIGLHLLAALQMAIWAMCFSYITKKVGIISSIIAITFLHALVSVIYVLPIWNMVMFSGLFVPLAVAAGANLLLAAIAFKLGARRLNK